MVEQVDQPIRRPLPRITGPARCTGSLEELADSLSKRLDLRFRRAHGGGVALDVQVVGQNDSMASRDRADFMATIGVERHENETTVGTADKHLFVMVFENHCAAAEL